MADFSRRLRQLLKEAGCTFVRQGKGDHEIWFSPVTGQPFTIDGKIVSRHSANGVPKDAGLPKAF